LFAADKVVGGNKTTKDLLMPQNLLNRRLSGSRSCESTNVAEGVFLFFFELEDFPKTCQFTYFNSKV